MRMQPLDRKEPPKLSFLAQCQVDPTHAAFRDRAHVRERKPRGRSRCVGSGHGNGRIVQWGNFRDSQLEEPSPWGTRQPAYGTKTTVMDRPWELYRAGQRADFTRHRAAMMELEKRDDDVSRCFALLLRQQSWLAGLADISPPKPADAVELATASTEAREIAGIACGLGARAATLAVEDSQLAGWVEAHELLLTGGGVGASDLWLDVSRSWQNLLGGDTQGVEERVRRVSAGARALALPDLRVEATVLRALIALIEEDLGEGTALARRASRMARTESLPQQEYVANLILARVRRLNGARHLALLILGALLRTAPVPYRPILAWEHLLCGGHGDRSVDTGGRVTRAVHALRAVLGACSRGDDSSLATAAAELHAATVGSWLEPDANAALHLLDPGANAEAASAAVAEWCQGTADTVPRGLVGLGRDSNSGDTALAIGGIDKPRRILARSVALIDNTCLVPKSNKPQLRTDGTIAALLLAGSEGLPEVTLFERIYGFSYAERHEAMLGMLYSRIRKRTGNNATLERDGNTVRLRCRRSLAIVDPRCAPPPEDRVLPALARSGGMSARELADALEIPLRTAQEALKRLTEEGACISQKVGRRLEYHLEDTTFQEPTNVVSGAWVTGGDSVASPARSGARLSGP